MWIWPPGDPDLLWNLVRKLSSVLGVGLSPILITKSSLKFLLAFAPATPAFAPCISGEGTAYKHIRRFIDEAFWNKLGKSKALLASS